MKWETLTSLEFANAVETSGKVCLFPIGVIEKHGDHLPLGMDLIHAYEVAVRAAELEPCVVFPQYFMGMNVHTKCEPGGIALKFDLLLPVLESMCDEIRRNGFRKIILYSEHGGNSAMLNYFCDKMLEAPKDYMVYVVSIIGGKTTAKEILKSKLDGHAGEQETSIMMYLHPEYVRCDTPAGYGLPVDREPYHKVDVTVPTGWYACHPQMLCADQTPGTVEKGARLVKEEAEWLAGLVCKIKEDDMPLALYREFLARCENPLVPSVPPEQNQKQQEGI